MLQNDYLYGTAKDDFQRVQGFSYDSDFFSSWDFHRKDYRSFFSGIYDL